MELTIKLKNSFGRLASREPFVITSAEDEKYSLNLDGDLRIYNAVAVFKMGDHVKEVKVPGYPHNYGGLNEIKRIEVPDEFVHEGILEVEISVLSHGFVVAKYHVEPIIFARVDTQFTGCPEFEELKAQVAQFKKENDELHDKIVAQDLQINLLKDDVARLFEIVEQQP